MLTCINHVGTNCYFQEKRYNSRDSSTRIPRADVGKNTVGTQEVSS